MKPNRAVQTAILLLSIAAGARVSAQNTEPATQSSAEIEQSLSSFVVAFDNLDWPAFRDCFSSEATVFHPAAPNAKRIDSPDQFEKAWLGVFARIKAASGRTTAPYMDLRPKDLRIQMLSDEIALVTFHLIDGATISRRTLVFKRFPGGWKIVHLHASNITTSAPQDAK
jgi:ketosteroid isomerase-like protein